MYLVVDMEATCFEQINVRDNNEIIEIGIVICERTGDVRNSFQSFVRPVITPKLSGFCKRLTKIKQEWIDSAETLGSVLLSVEKWMKANGVSNPQSAKWVSFGNGDNQYLQRDCARHRLWTPFGEYKDLKRIYATVSGCKQCGLKEALERENIPWVGQKHRANWDAINAAQLAKKLAPVIMGEMTYLQLRQSSSSEQGS